MEKCFNLMYYVPGVTDTGLDEMDKRTRDWLFERLVRQKKTEQDEQRKANNR